MDSKLRLAVLEKALSHDVAKDANAAIEAAERVVETRAALEKRRQAALAAYKEEVQAVDDMLGSLQRHCQHPAVTDFVGGQPGDSYSRCDLCSAEVRSRCQR